MPGHTRWNSRFARSAMLALCCLSLSLSPALQADQSDSAPLAAAAIGSRSNDVEALLSQTSALEKEHRWGEALQLYSEATRTFPDNSTLRERQLLAQIHYDLSRRYNDAGFRKTVRATDPAQALAIYSEVLNKIQTYHVQTPDWPRIAALGSQSLEIALSDRVFLDANAPGVTDLQAATSSQMIRQIMASYSVQNHQDAYVVASSIARQLQDRIGLPPAAAVYEFIFGSMIALDPYSSFMTESQFNETMSQIEGNFVGIGVELKTGPKLLEIVNVIPNGPAGKAGLAAGDIIEAVDEQLTEQVGSEVAADLMRGREGSMVSLRIRRGSAVKKLGIVRRQVDIPSITEARMLDSQIGYIRIASFQKTTPHDFDAALARLHQQGLQALIVDVRGNPGGLLSASVEIADRFVQSGIIVSTRGRNPLEDFVHRAVPGGTWQMPLAVLVDENSASASEIFAAAIADHKRGQIVGAKSYGKGSVQGIFPLSVAGGGLRLTTAKFYGPAGEAIQNNGVKPDVEVHRVAKATESQSAEPDTALDIAVRVVRQSTVR